MPLCLSSYSMATQDTVIAMDLVMVIVTVLAMGIVTDMITEEATAEKRKINIKALTALSMLQEKMSTVWKTVPSMYRKTLAGQIKYLHQSLYNVPLIPLL